MEQEQLSMQSLMLELFAIKVKVTLGRATPCQPAAIGPSSIGASQAYHWIKSRNISRNSWHTPTLIWNSSSS